MFTSVFGSISQTVDKRQTQTQRQNTEIVPTQISLKEEFLAIYVIEVKFISDRDKKKSILLSLP